MPKPLKIRLDVLCWERGLAPSRERARALVMAGKIMVDGRTVAKPGTSIDPSAVLTRNGEDLPFVSRGGLKLQAALKFFNISVRDTVCIDIGASTGGFTDCLLQHGARCVYAVDVGYGQLAWPLRQDKRVIVMERTNARHLKPDDLEAPADLGTIDAAFISLKLIVPPLRACLKPAGTIIALIKPQFEVGKGQVGKGGVVRDPRLHDQVIENLKAFFRSLQLDVRGVCPSPLRGPKGNREFLIHLRVPCV